MGSSARMGPAAFKGRNSYKKYRDVVQMDLNSLLSGEDNHFTPAKQSQIDIISSKQSSVALDHDQLLEQIGLNKSE